MSLFRTFAGTENEKVMNSLFSSLNRNYGVFEYSNDSGSKKVEIVAKEYMRGKFLRSKVCSTMQIRRGEGMIGVLLDSDKGESWFRWATARAPAESFGLRAWCFRTKE